MSLRSRWRALATLGVALAVALGGLVPIQLATGAQSAAAADASNFDPGYIIADPYFFDANAMSAGEIQAFLDAQIGPCANGACLNVISIAFPGAASYYAAKTGNLVCTAIPAEVVPVSQFIYQVQQACGISAKVILVTLQKEEALISGPSAQAPTQGRLNIAMGYACPDTAACDTRYYGVANQIYWGAWQFKIYSAGNFFRQPGLNYIQYSPNAACGGTTVNIRSYGTAALYNYTPYQPNSAALANLYGSGDGCSSFGNRNFWRYYSDWFGNPAGNPPVGWMDTATVAGSTVTASGWAIDTDAPSGAVPVQLKIDGAIVTSGYANVNRPGLGAAVLPAAGDFHGYTLTAAVSVGAHVVCVIGLDAGPNGGAPPSTLSHTGAGAVNNCAVITVSAPPVGWMDGVSVLGAKATATGWAIDPDTAAPVQVRLLVDGASAASTTADTPKPGLAAALHSTAGDNHGYSMTATLPVGTHTLCVVAVNNAPGPDARLSYAAAGASNNCAVVGYPGPRSPVGWIDAASTVGSKLTVSGWTIDPDTAAGVPVQLLVDGAVTTTGTATLPRPGLGAAILPAAGDNHGYTLSATLTAGAHTACVVALDDATSPSSRLPYAGSAAANGCVAVNYPGPRPPVGWIDSAALAGSNVTVSGWAIDPDTAAGIQVRLTVDGALVATGTADVVRPGLGAAVGMAAVGDAHGYSLSTTLTIGTHTVCVVGVNDAGSPDTTLRYSGANSSGNCVVLTPTGSARPVGWMDSVVLSGSALTVSGWAIDPDTAAAVQVQLLVDGAVVTTGPAGASRPGLGAAVGMPALGDAHGYSLSTALATGRHVVCVVGVNNAAGSNTTLSYAGPNASSGCAVVTR